MDEFDDFADTYEIYEQSVYNGDDLDGGAHDGDWEDDAYPGDDGDHDEACNGTVVEDGDGDYYCSSRCGWTAEQGRDVVDYEDVEHDPR